LLQETLAQLFSTLKESSAKVDTTAAIGQSLHKVTGNLNALMAGFTFHNAFTIEPGQHEQRNFPRISNRLLVKVKQGGIAIESSTLDLSMAGMRLRLNEQLNESKPLELEIYLPQESLQAYEQQAPLKLRGTINWQRMVDNIHQCGVSYENLTADANQKLRECFQYFHKIPEFDSNA